MNEIDRDGMIFSLKTSTEFLNENSCRLCEQVRHLVQFYEELLDMNLVPYDKNDENNDKTIADIGLPYSFIVSFMEIYNTNLHILIEIPHQVL